MGDPTVYQDPDYAEVGQQSDTRLMTEDGTVFHVNSELLSRHSKFFNSLFLMGEEAGQSTVIRDIKSDIFRILLNYMSTGKVLLTTENVMHLLVASDFLMIESLVDECRKFVLREKREENIVSYFITANRIKGLDLADQCRRFLVRCFEKAVMHSMDEVCRLPYVDLIYFLSHRSLNVSNEHTIWSVIEAWVQEDPVDRHPLVPGLLRCLSIHEISDELASNILSSPIIRKNTFYRDVGDLCETFDLLSDKMKAESIISFRNQLPIITKVRLPRFLHVVAKLFQDRDTAELYLSYDDSLDLWRKVGDISLRGAIILVSGHLVYYIKRFLDGRYEFTGFYYDLLRNEERSMALPHCGDYIVVEIGGSVYALQVRGTIMKRYVNETNEWVGVRRVRFQGSAVSALNVNGLLHVLYENRRNNMFMRMYDPSKDEWWRLPSPTAGRCHAESAVYHDKIFLVAGRIEGSYEKDDDDINGPLEAMMERMGIYTYNIEKDQLISKAVEVYDPKSNEWVMYPELPFRFSPVHVSVVKDRLYVYQNHQHPVTYWDGSGQWKIEEDPSRLFQHKFSAVKNEDVMREMMRRNKEEDPTVWQETGLEKVVP